MIKNKKSIILIIINFILLGTLWNIYVYKKNKYYQKNSIQYELTRFYTENNVLATRIINKMSILEMHGVSYIPKEDKFNIFLIWYGDKFPDIYFKCLETLVFHHPKADILLFSNELNESLIEPFRQKGYNNVHIVRFNLTKMVENKPGYDFVLKANQLLNGEKLSGIQVTRVHLSDFLRYFLVYNYGGFYIDTDSFVIKNMEHLKNTIGVTDNFSYKCSGKVFNAPNAKNFTCISNSVYHFDKHHPFMRDALINYDIWWIRHQGYAPAGAVMLMELIEKNFDKINFHPQKEIICFYHLGQTRHIVNEDDPNLKDALNTCYTIQMLGAGSSNYIVDNFTKTLVGHIYNKFKIF